MAYDELTRAVQRRPFIPFRLTLAEGSVYEVRHPEMCMPGKRSAIIGFPAKGDRSVVFDDWVLVDLFHVVKLEPLEAGSSAPNTTN